MSSLLDKAIYGNVEAKKDRGAVSGFENDPLFSGGGLRGPPDPRDKKIKDPGFDHRPLGLFALHETYAAAACFAVFCVTHVLAYLAEGLADKLPVRDDGPLVFMSVSLSWIGSVGVVVAFSIITVYQVGLLFGRLSRK